MDGFTGWWEKSCFIILLCVGAAVASQAQTLTTLVSFNGANGQRPRASLVQGMDGNFYGTTEAGGANGLGTIFRMTPGGALTTLHSFDSADGANPWAGLIQTAYGLFYGTTYFGGSTGCGGSGCGAIFGMTPAGGFATLYSFNGTDGNNPNGGLAQAANGNLYGTTIGGGNNGYGSIFKTTPAGTLTPVYSFGGLSDGYSPFAGLIQATNGNLYGTSFGGYHSHGTVFRITPAGVLTKLYDFDYTDGANPFGGLVQSADGNLYGTTSTGGTGGSNGTIFKITPAGALITLYNFAYTDGSYPFAALVQAIDGNLYGTTVFGGTSGNGTVFQVTPGGTLTTLYSFCPQFFNCTDGYSPYGGLLQGTDGTFYGTTTLGGANGNAYGTVFRLSLGLSPFVKTLPASAKVGAKVRILGTNLTGATRVNFGATAAGFTVVSPSLISATVPVGATSGKVRVATPGGTLVSNAVFRVMP